MVRCRLLSRDTPNYALEDTQSYAPPSSRLNRPGFAGGCGGGLLSQEPVELAQPVAPPVDVDEVHVVQQAVDDRGGEDLVPAS